MSPPRLSILICAVPARLSTTLPKLFAKLEEQTKTNEVEVLCLLDDRKRTTGEKRNSLLKIAQGEYVSFVDDDDRVAPNYVEAILRAIKKTPAPDVVVFNVWVSGYRRSLGLPDRTCRYDISFSDQNLAHEYQRKPNHLMVWRAELARSVPFQARNRGEDFAWAKDIARRHPKLRQNRIEEILYYYDYNPRLSGGARVA